MTANNLLMQFLADVLDVPVVRPTVAETTCLGAAYAAGLAVGFWPDLDDAARQLAGRTAWHARDGPGSGAGGRLPRWRKAVERTLNWAWGSRVPTGLSRKQTGAGR